MADHAPNRDAGPEPQAAAAEAAGADNELADLMGWVRACGRPVLIGVAVAALAAVGVAFHQRSHRAAVEEAARMLTSGRPEQLQAILVQYRRSPSAPIARLAIARLDFHNGRFEEAEKKYAEFLALHRGHPLALAAEVNRATCLEARGRLDEALKAYDAVLAREKTSLFASVAMLGRARTFEQMGRYTDARQAYEDYLVANPDGPFAGVADAGLKTLDQKQRMAQKVVSLAQPPAPPGGTNMPPPAPGAATNAAPMAPAIPPAP